MLCALKFKILTATILLVYCWAAASEARPSWVEHPPADAQFVYAVGMSSNARSVQEGAQAAVEQGVVQILNYYGFKGQAIYHERKTQLLTRSLEDYRTESDVVRMENVLVRDWSFERLPGGRYETFALVVYPVSKLKEEKMRQEQVFSHLLKEAQAGLELAKAAEDKGDILDACRFYSEAAGVISRVEKYDSFRTSILLRAADMLGRVKLVKISGDKQTVLPYQHAFEPLTVQVLLERACGDLVPVSGVTVSFVLTNDRDLKETSLTDANGIASCSLKRITASGSTIRVHASVENSLRIIPGPRCGITPVLERGAVDFSVNLRRPRLQKAISVCLHGESRDVSAGIAADVMREMLMAAGFNVSSRQPGADIQITGNVKTQGRDNLGYIASCVAVGNVTVSMGRYSYQRSCQTQKKFGESSEIADSCALHEIGHLLAEEVGSILSNIEAKEQSRPI